MTNKKYTYEVVNIVAHANLDTNIDLFNLAMGLDTAEYEPEQFPGLILRVPEPRSTLLVFKNGKIICTGTKSEKDVKRSIAAAIKMMKEALPSLKLPDPDKVEFKIENIVTSASLRRNVDLFTLAEMEDRVEYEPEQFPGAIIRLGEGKPTILLFKNGNLICAGARSEKEVVEAIEEVEKIIEPYSTPLKEK